MKKKNNLIRFYLWLGLAYATLWSWHTWSNFDGNIVQLLANNLWRIVYVVVINFIFFEVTIPFVLGKRRFLISNILWGLFLLWAHTMLWSYGLYGWRALGTAIGFYSIVTPFTSVDAATASLMGYSVGSLVLFGIARHIYNYVSLKQTSQRLLIEKQTAELNYLRSQTNPHFLFNTLNNIFSLARDKSDLAPESILRLSKILRFMLYETSGNYIAIEQELKIIQDYIELERLRYDERLQIKFNHNVEDMKQSIHPLLLIPLVENAFKHGVSETRGKPFVDIHLSVEKRLLHFIVKNSVETRTADPIRENIGLSNLRRQLELLYKHYELKVDQDESVFTASLKINLGTHA